MKLLLDLGNTRLKWALHDGGEFQREGSLTIDDPPEPQLSDMLGAAWAPASEVFFASVARDGRAAEVEAAVRAVTALPVQRVAAAAKSCGVTCAYEDPARLGVDRWLAVIAAYRRSSGQGGRGALVVDCGSAITLDAVTADGKHLGGQIAPGIAMMRRALYRDTGRIPDEGEVEAGLLGRDTRTAVSAGTLYAAAGFVQHVSDELLPQIGSGSRLYITGGDAEAIQSKLRSEFEFQPRLVMEGLLAMAEEMACVR